MALPKDSLPETVRDALRGGNKMEAIRRLRQTTGVDLKEARARIDAQSLNDTRLAAREALIKSGVPGNVLDALQRGSFLEAARQYFDHRRRTPSLSASRSLDVVRPPFSQRGDAPPELFHRVVTLIWWLLAFTLAGMAAYFFLFKSG